MEPSKIHCLVRVEAGPGIGLGHLARCLALALWLRKWGAESVFVMACRDRDALDRVTAKGFPVIQASHSGKTGSDSDAASLAALAREQGATWIVADGYSFGPIFFCNLRAATLAAILAIDDFQGSLEADLILNQNLGIEEGLYAQSKAEVLQGPEYCLLPPGYQDQEPRDYPDGVKRILVTTGGGDPTGITGDVLAALLRFPGLEADAVVGPFAGGGLGTFSDQKNISFHHGLSSLKDFIYRADLAVMSLGVTTWEMAALGLPFVMMPHHPAQMPTARWLEENGCASLGMELGRFDENRFLDVIKSLLDNPVILTNQSKALTKLVDGRGGARTVAAMDRIRSVTR